MRDEDYEPTEDQIQEMLAERESYDRQRYYEKCLDPRSRDYWDDRIDEAMDREENQR